MSNPEFALRDIASRRSRTDERAGTRGASTAQAKENIASSRAALAKPSTGKVYRLIANEQYFGMDASVFHAGAERLVARASADATGGIDSRNLAEDFGVDAVASRRLLTAFVAGGLLQPNGTARYRPTPLLCAYAQSCVVVPLARDRARALIERAGEMAARINATWIRNPYVIDEIAVSGSFMSRDKLLGELSLWLVLARRARPGRSAFSISDEGARREIGAAIKAISSFIVVRAAIDRREIRRPFAIVFEAAVAETERQSRIWNRLRDFGGRVRRRLS